MCQVTMVGMDEECLRSIKESKTLAGIFQSVVDDCKVSTLQGTKQIAGLNLLRNNKK